MVPGQRRNPGEAREVSNVSEARKDAEVGASQAQGAAARPDE